MYVLLYNPKSKNNKSFKIVTKLRTYFKKNDILCDFKNILLINDYEQFIKSLENEHKIIIIGGDGTFSNFMRNIKDIEFENKIYLYPAGTGNDFIKNFKTPHNIEMFNKVEKLRKLKADLPNVKMNGKEHHFINGIGIGFDGEVASKVNASRLKNTFSYLTMSIKTIFNYECYDMEANIDGEVIHFKNVWLSSIQNGQYFGGGMKICPAALLDDNLLDVCIIHSLSKIKFLVLLPTVFSGNHLKYKDFVYYRQAKDIKLKLNQKKRGQLDGDLFNFTSEIHVHFKNKFFNLF